jgi:hypothetical protein
VLGAVHSTVPPLKIACSFWNVDGLATNSQPSSLAALPANSPHWCDPKPAAVVGTLPWLIVAL